MVRLLKEKSYFVIHTQPVDRGVCVLAAFCNLVMKTHS